MKFTSVGLLDHSRTIVNCYDRIQELGCIMNGIDRKNGSMMEGRFQVSERQVEWYREYLESAS
jgi:hypothetical protein